MVGPEEFVEGLALGTHQFIGGTVGKMTLKLYIIFLLLFQVVHLV